MFPIYMLYEFAKDRYKELLYSPAKVKQCSPQRAIKLCRRNKVKSLRGSQKPIVRNSVLLNRDSDG